MRNNSTKYISLIFFILLTVWALSCSGRSGKVIEQKGKAVPAVNADDEIRLIRMKSPEENSSFRSGDPVNVILTSANPGTEPDSVQLYYDGKAVVTLKQSPWEYSIPGSFTLSTGRRSLKAVAYRGGRSRTTIARFMIILSDVIPGKFSYKIINEYPHDRAAFTQGLFYDNGLLYEGTGQETG